MTRERCVFSLAIRTQRENCQAFCMDHPPSPLTVRYYVEMRGLHFGF
jgi:hypothetical protein